MNQEKENIFKMVSHFPKKLNSIKKDCMLIIIFFYYYFYYKKIIFPLNFVYKPLFNIRIKSFNVDINILIYINS